MDTEERKVNRLLRKEKGNMALKSVESQNVEFKSNWRDEAGGNYKLKSWLGDW